MQIAVDVRAGVLEDLEDLTNAHRFAILNAEQIPATDDQHKDERRVLSQ